jgi:hypothetical protein
MDAVSKFYSDVRLEPDEGMPILERKPVIRLLKSGLRSRGGHGPRGRIRPVFSPSERAVA